MFIVKDVCLSKFYIYKKWKLKNTMLTTQFMHERKNGINKH